MRLVSFTRTIVSLVGIFLLGGAYGGDNEDLLMAKLATNFRVTYSRGGVKVHRVFELRSVLKASPECGVIKVVELGSTDEATTKEFVFKICLTKSRGGFLAVQNEWHAMQYLTWKVAGMKEPDYTTVIPQRVHPVLTEVYFCERIKVFKDSELECLVVCMESLEESFQTILNLGHKSEEVVYWEISVLELLQFLKVNEIVHRDLKPDNFVLDKQRNIHVIDFSFAYFPETKYPAKTCCGTLDYMSIRAYEKWSNTDPKALDDGFAFAYFCLQILFPLPWQKQENPEAKNDEQKLKELEEAKKKAELEADENETEENVKKIDDYDSEINNFRLLIDKHNEDFEKNLMSLKENYAEEIMKTQGYSGAEHAVIVKTLYNNILTAKKNSDLNYKSCRNDFAMYYNKKFEKPEREVRETLGGMFSSRAAHFFS